jgi:hypothetical protein
VLRRIHRDEHRRAHHLRFLHRYRRAERYAAFGRVHLVVRIDVHDVFELRHRPIRAERALGTVVHRGFLAKPFEVAVLQIVLEQRRLGDVYAI